MARCASPPHAPPGQEVVAVARATPVAGSGRVNPAAAVLAVEAAQAQAQSIQAAQIPLSDLVEAAPWVRAAAVTAMHQH